MTLRRLLVLPLLLMAALLVGCGSDDSPSSGGSSERGSERQNTGDEKRGERADAVGTDDFTLIPPDGWIDNSDAVPGSDFAYSNSSDRFPNINVIRTPGPKMSISEFEDLAVAELEKAGFTAVTVHDPYKVDGVRSPVVTAEATIQGISYQTRQYYAQHDGAYYIITISLDPDASEDDAIDISEQIIDTWRWES